MWNRQDVKANAKALMKKNYWGSVIAALIATLFTAGNAYNAYDQTQDGSSAEISNLFKSANLSDSEMMALVGLFFGIIGLCILIGYIAKLVAINPLKVGVCRYFTQCGEQEKPSLKELLYGFQHSFGSIVLAMFTTDFFTALWSLLFVIPGIIKGMQWLMVPYILADHPEMKGSEARALSREMMQGNKWKAFMLGLSFIGWAILGVITFGLVLVFYVNPYYHHSFAELYRTLKKERGETAGQTA